MKTLTLTTLSALTLITLGTAAYAGGFGGGMGPGMAPGMGMGPGMGNGPQIVEKADTNKDGKVDAAELSAYFDKALTEANTDGKDGVTIQEFEPWFWQQQRQMMVRAFQHLDADGDGIVTKAELDSMGKVMLDRLDRNDDGSISQDDRAQRGGRDGERGPGHGRQGMKGNWFGWGGNAPAGGPAGAGNAPAN